MAFTPAFLFFVGPTTEALLWYLTFFAMILWGFDLAHQLRQPILSYVSSIALLGFLFLLASNQGQLIDFGLLVTAATPALLLIIAAILNRFLRSPSVTANLARPIHQVSLVATGLLSVACSFCSPELGTTPILLGLTTLTAVALMTREEIKRDAALAAISVVLLLFPIHLSLPNSMDGVIHLFSQPFNQAPLLAFIGCVVSIVWQLRLQRQRISDQQGLLASIMLIAAAVSTAIAWPTLFFLRTISPLDACLIAASSLLLAGRLLEDARQQQDTQRVWGCFSTLLLGLLPLAFHGIIPLGSPFAPVIVASTSFVLFGLAQAAVRTQRYAIAAEPLRLLAALIPLGVPLVILAQAATGEYHALPASTGLLIAAGFGFWRGIEGRRRDDLILAAINANLSLALIWHRLGYNDPQLYMIPVGVTLLMFVEILRREIPARWHDPLRYLGSLIILVSPVFRILDGSWLAYFTLMLSATIVLFVAMGLRVRALLYTATAFLVGDLIAIVIRGCVDQPQFLWIAGIGLGTTVVFLAAYCERRRDRIIERIQTLSAALGKWS